MVMIRLMETLHRIVRHLQSSTDTCNLFTKDKKLKTRQSIEP